MKLPQLSLRDLFWLVLLGCGSISSNAPADDKLSAKLTVEVERVVLANVPLQLQLKITNTGNAPISYWWGGPGGYPSAFLLSVKVTDDLGRTRSYPLHNGQYEEGSGIHRMIETTQTMPVASDPLSPGVYTLHVSSRADGYTREGNRIETWPATQAEPVKITVVEDRTKLAEAEAALLAQAKKDPFARHVAQVYGIDPVVKGWLRQLNSNNIALAHTAIGELQRVRRLPPGGDEQLKTAATLHINPPYDDPDPTVLEYLARISRTIGTEKGLDAILIIANSQVRPNPRAIAVRELGHFPGERAQKELLRLAADKDAGVSWASILGLARHGHRAALQPLLEAVKEDNPGRRVSALHALGMLRDLPEARSALAAALEHKDEEVRRAAKRALERTPDDAAQ